MVKLILEAVGWMCLSVIAYILFIYPLGQYVAIRWKEWKHDRAVKKMLVTLAREYARELMKKCQ